MNQSDLKTRPVTSYPTIKESAAKWPGHYNLCPNCGELKFKRSALCRSCQSRYRPYIQQPDNPEIRYIPLTKGQFTIVSVGDYEWLIQWKWSATWNKTMGSFYATRTDYTSGKAVNIKMHRAILGLEPGDKRVGDHIKCEQTLNNTRENLRIATSVQNAHNRRIRKDSTSGYKGVRHISSYGPGVKKPWETTIYVNGKNIWLGAFATPLEAYQVRCRELLKYHGEFSRAE